MSKCLTESVWNELKDKKDKFGCTLGHIINSGVVNLDSGIGVYAGSEESYTIFAPLFDKGNLSKTKVKIRNIQRLPKLNRVRFKKCFNVI